MKYQGKRLDLDFEIGIDDVTLIEDEKNKLDPVFDQIKNNPMNYACLLMKL